MLKMKGSTTEEEVEDSQLEESSAEGGEDIDEELVDSNEDEEAEGVLQKDSNDLVLSDPEGIALTGCLILFWQVSCKYMLQIAHILSPYPVV